MEQRGTGPRAGAGRPRPSPRAGTTTTPRRPELSREALRRAAGGAAPGLRPARLAERRGPPLAARGGAAGLGAASEPRRPAQHLVQHAAQRPGGARADRAYHRRRAGDRAPPHPGPRRPGGVLDRPAGDRLARGDPGRRRGGPAGAHLHHPHAARAGNHHADPEHRDLFLRGVPCASRLAANARDARREPLPGPGRRRGAQDLLAVRRVQLPGHLRDPRHDRLPGLALRPPAGPGAAPGNGPPRGRRAGRPASRPLGGRARRAGGRLQHHVRPDPDGAGRSRGLGAHPRGPRPEQDQRAAARARPDDPGGEADLARQAGRRRGPRDQQPPLRDPHLRPAAAEVDRAGRQARGARTRDARLAGADREREPALRRHRPQPPHLRPRAPSQRHRLRPEPHRHPDHPPGRAQARAGEHRPPPGARLRPAAHPRRRGPDRTAPAGHRDERHRGHAP